MSKYAITYKDYVPLSRAHDVIVERCQKLLNATEYDEGLLRNLCMTYAYTSFNTLPKNKLRNGLCVSVAEVCQNVEGLIAISMHEVLTRVCDIVRRKDIHKNLIGFSTEALLPEVNELLGLGDIHADIYKAFVKTLFLYDKKPCSITADTSVTEVESMFKTEYNVTGVSYD